MPDKADFSAVLQVLDVSVRRLPDDKCLPLALVKSSGSASPDKVATFLPLPEMRVARATKIPRALVSGLQRHRAFLNASSASSSLTTPIVKTPRGGGVLRRLARRAQPALLLFTFFD